MSDILEHYKKRDPRERTVARALCIHEGKVLVVKRFKYGDSYYVLPGGGIDPGETPEVAAAREVYEETSVKVVPGDIVLNLPGTEKHSEQFIVKCTYIEGVPHLPDESEEAQRTDEGQNTYEPTWLPVDDAKKTVIPIEIRNLLS